MINGTVITIIVLFEDQGDMAFYRDSQQQFLHLCGLTAQSGKGGPRGRVGKVSEFQRS